MGSQSVTNFSAAKQKRIRELIKDYSSDKTEAERQAQARAIGEAAVGLLGKGPANEFLQALSSRSVETAIGLILYLAEGLKKDPQRIYEKYGIAQETQPVESFSAKLTEGLETILSASQTKTDTTDAVKEAIPKTVIDVVSHAFPREKEPVDVDLNKFAEAFKKVGREEIATAFMENVAGELINKVLDATRGRFHPGQVDKIKQGVRKRFVPEFIQRFKRGR